MNKFILIQDLVAQLNRSLEDTISAADAARETATDAENVAENRYDTLGLEAAYLAHGQSSRAVELHKTIQSFNRLSTEEGQSSAVCLGSLVEVTDENNSSSFFLIGPGAGGMKVISQEVEVTVLTREAPMGNALYGKEIGDEVSTNSGWLTVNNII